MNIEASSSGANHDAENSVDIDQAADIRHRTGMKLPHAYILATAQVNGAILIDRKAKDFPAAMPGIRVPYTL